ncbi:MAG: RHS repeat-associated core domain-containing protein [Clostridia bacterium]|nr:RHS repeat-associated core domain-containing protein [Clostridia bacterium]
MNYDYQKSILILLKTHSQKSYQQRPKFAAILLPSQSQTVDYTAFNKTSHISQGTKDYFITYGPDRLRRKTSLRNDMADDALMTKYYGFGDYEKETTPTGTRHLHYIQGGDGLAAVYVKNDGGSDSLYFIMKDHLGSIVGAINSEGGKVYRQSFDAWGRNRNPQNWTYDDIPEYFPLSRGYTGHEHLKWFGLINMNGRMYDATLCRFLSPDPFVQMPDYSQNFNRYSYALNNPLVFTDPTGEFPIVFAIGFIVGAYLGGLSSNDWKLNPREWEMNTNTFLAMGFGGLAGGFGGQYLLGAGGVLSGGTPLNVAIGSNIGNTFNAGANFVVSNGSVMLQGLGYTTAAGGGAYYLINQNQGQNYQQMVDQEIYKEQKDYYSTMEMLAGEQFGVDAISGQDIKLAWMYNNFDEGRASMWDMSFKDGVASRKVGAWNTPQGLIVMNPMFNKINESRWDWLEVDGNMVKFNGESYWINTYEHSHPYYNYGDIGVSPSDRQMAKKFGCLILWNDSVWQVFPNGKYRNLFPIKGP